MENPKCPYCIHCDAPVGRIDYSARLKTLVVGVGAVITYVEVSAHCHECGMELYIPEINDMNKLSRDNAYTAATKRDMAKGEWIDKGYHEEWTFECSVCGGWSSEEYDFCPNCGADMREANDE